MLSVLKMLLNEKLQEVGSDLPESNLPSAFSLQAQEEAEAARLKENDKYSENIVKLRESAHRESIKEKAGITYEEYCKFTERQLSLEIRAIERLKKGLAQISKHFSAEIEKAKQPRRTRFLDFLFGKGSIKNSIQKETQILKSQTLQLHRVARSLQEDCIEKNLILQEHLEKVTAALGIIDFIPQSDPTLRALSEFRREKMIFSLLNRRIENTDVLIEKNLLKMDELRHQSDEEKTANELLTAKVNLLRIGNPRFRDNFKRPKSSAERDLSILARAQDEMRSPAHEVEMELREINSERLALQEELDELAKQLTTITRRLGNEDAGEHEPRFNLGRSAKTHRSDEAL